MKIHIERGDTVIEYERHSMPEGRFRALCSLVLAAIVGGVFLGAIALVGVWAIGAALAAFVLYGLYQIDDVHFRIIPPKMRKAAAADMKSATAVPAFSPLPAGRARPAGR